MGSLSLLKQSLNYPIKDKKDFIVIAVILSLTQIVDFILISILNINSSTIISTINFIFNIIIFGYLLNVIKSTIKNHDEMPIFYFKKNIISGIKASILRLIYFIIPIFLTVILSFFLKYNIDILHKIPELILIIIKQSYTLKGSANALYVFKDLVFHNLFLAVFALILIIIFDIAGFIAIGRLAETNSLREGLKVKKIFKKIGSIGWFKYIHWYVIFVIFIIIYTIFTVIVSLIPLLGYIL
ncbi:MAG: DUF4013 domain-containing protein [Methanobacteriaceae archaeon]|nr:DUF4013 domain-containing protein [Methanobacteriaceae archaeon]